MHAIGTGIEALQLQLLPFCWALGHTLMRCQPTHALPSPTATRTTQNEPELTEALLGELATFRQPRLGAAGANALK